VAGRTVRAAVLSLRVAVTRRIRRAACWLARPAYGTLATLTGPRPLWTAALPCRFGFLECGSPVPLFWSAAVPCRFSFSKGGGPLPISQGLCATFCQGGTSGVRPCVSPGPERNRRGRGPDRRRAGDGAVVPPPRRGGEDGSGACAGTQRRAEARVPRQPGLLRAASRRLGEPAAPSAVATAGKGKQCGSRQAAGSRPLRPAAEAATAGRAPLSILRRAGVSFARRGPLLPALRWRQRLGADPRPGRATTVPPSQRRRSGPARPRARGRFGGSPKRREVACAPLSPPRRAVFLLGGGHCCQRLPRARALRRNRGRVALPMRRRRRDGGPPLPSSRQAAALGPLRPAAEAAGESPPHCRSRDGWAFIRSVRATDAAASLAPAPWGGPEAGSRSHCRAVAARRSSPARRRARGRFGGSPKRRERARPMADSATGGRSFLWLGDHFCQRLLRCRGQPRRGHVQDRRRMAKAGRARKEGRAPGRG